MKDTLRLLITLKCNFNCEYCCNEQEEFNSQFCYKNFSEIDLNQYRTICITGGEPFINRDLLYGILDEIPLNKRVYIYTNGTLIEKADVFKLSTYDNLRGLSIGVHSSNQLYNINRDVYEILDCRFMIRDTMYDQIKIEHIDRLKGQAIKLWSMNDCNMPNEDWIVLKGI